MRSAAVDMTCISTGHKAEAAYRAVYDLGRGNAPRSDSQIGGVACGRREQPKFSQSFRPSALKLMHVCFKKPFFSDMFFAIARVAEWQTRRT